MKIALDTNLLIDFFEDVKPYAGKMEKILESFLAAENEGIVSTVCVAELLMGFYSLGETAEAAKVKQLLSDLTLANFKIVPVTFEIADLAASLRSKRGGDLPDALIAATAISQECAVVYSRDKDFRRFQKDIKICESP